MYIYIYIYICTTVIGESALWCESLLESSLRVVYLQCAMPCPVLAVAIRIAMINDSNSYNDSYY